MVVVKLVSEKVEVVLKDVKKVVKAVIRIKSVKVHTDVHNVFTGNVRSGGGREES